MVNVADDVLTLRLVTLRSLLRATIAPVVVGVGTSVEFVRRVLREMPAAICVVVDPTNTLLGAIELHELTACAGDVAVERVMSSATAIVRPEQDVEALRRAMRASDADRVIVVDHDGSLLGALRAGDLNRRCAA